ncbi:uncharacterized protein STEHIDRAFT_113279 [Stereum hirsutum FP-91666 SS1]|uniref:uncharacterized protein n=1 Tax=Stereum hirsutum (strain FP-91666) TaxID=721885 RepID=UPI000444A103|nr:uncharacterized protein STEHIDRAFT_113279 [Stereum hirsutum FP-91666 SS1]EIM84084.1 hypothetical protein STEHIDRAFT_113279 [Stereum hirsutum FP-91666 SS1]
MLVQQDQLEPTLAARASVKRSCPDIDTGDDASVDRMDTSSDQAYRNAGGREVDVGQEELGEQPAKRRRADGSTPCNTMALTFSAHERSKTQKAATKDRISAMSVDVLFEPVPYKPESAKCSSVSLEHHCLEKREAERRTIGPRSHLDNSNLTRPTMSVHTHTSTTSLFESIPSMEVIGALTVRVKYWRPDVDGTAQLVSRYAEAVVVGKRGSERVLQQFLSERRKSVGLTVLGEEWYTAYQANRESVMKKRYEAQVFIFIFTVDEVLQKLTQLQHQEPHDRRRLFFYRHGHPRIP